MRLNALLAIGSLAVVFASAAAMSAEEFLGRYGNPSRQKNFKGLRPTASMRSALGSDHEMKAARAPRPMEDRKLGERRAYRSKVGTGERKNVAAKMRSAYRKTPNGPEFRSGKFYPRSEIRTFFSTYSNQFQAVATELPLSMITTRWRVSSGGTRALYFLCLPTRRMEGRTTSTPMAMGLCGTTPTGTGALDTGTTGKLRLFILKVKSITKTDLLLQRNSKLRCLYR